MTAEHAQTAQPQAPRISVVLLSYNQESMVERAALACLALQGGPYEMVFSDDASTDASFDKLQAIAAAYRGPHRVSVRRNPVNVGIGEHYNQLLLATQGELIVTAAGDDVSVPQRVTRLAAAWEATGRKADLIASHVVDMDDQGGLHEVIRVDDLGAYRCLDDWLARRPYIIGAGHAFTRRMMERFGPLDPKVAYEDQIMVFRAIVSGGAVTVDEPLVHYRRGGASARPCFTSPEHMRRWRSRQLSRELAEMEQLLADAQAIGCAARVHETFTYALPRVRYLLDLHQAASNDERWRLFKNAHGLPLFWRLRKFMHLWLPQVSWVVKRGLSLLHRRQHL
jgi:glycosyltransferase involved in cell wall biosynthesis